MSERPILFSGPMIRALLDGRKTQTRRVVKAMAGEQSRWLTPELLGKVPSVEVGTWACGFGVQLQHPQGGPLGWVRCPYGVRGDRLWVREAWAEPNDQIVIYRANWREDAKARGLDNIPADDTGIRWKPSIHMRRRDCRLLLVVTEVRVERLQDISEADATAEGTQEPSLVPTIGACWSERDAYAKLWEHINGLGSWAANPWVWAVSFEAAQ